MPALLSILMLAVHLLAMNVASGAPVIAAWLVTRRGADSEGARYEGRRLLWLSLASLGVGMMLGGALLLAPSAGMRQAMERFPASAYWFAASELAFSAACAAVLLLLTRGERRRPPLVWLVALASTTNLVYHFPPLMIVMGKLAASPAWTTIDPIARRDLVGLMLRPEVAAMWIHFALASVAVAAIAALWQIARSRRSNSGGVADAQSSQAFVRGLAGVALVATALQLPIGGWILAAAPNSMRSALLGDHIAASALFLVGVVSALKLMQALAVPLFGETTTAALRAPAIWTLVVVLSMTATLRLTSSAVAPRTARSTTVNPAAAHSPASSDDGSSFDFARSPAGSFPSAMS